MADTILVRVAQFAVGGPDVELVTLGLGSCVAIVLHDPIARLGGLAHALLPDPSTARETSNPAKFAETAVPALVAELERHGAERGRLRAKLVGGAAMFANLLQTNGLNMGERNVQAARAALAALAIPVVAEDVGGDYGRSVRFAPRDGRVRVRSVARGEEEL